jgi:hypothetical protein
MYINDVPANCSTNSTLLGNDLSNWVRELARSRGEEKRREEKRREEEKKGRGDIDRRDLSLSLPTFLFRHRIAVVAAVLSFCLRAQATRSRRTLFSFPFL